MNFTRLAQLADIKTGSRFSSVRGWHRHGGAHKMPPSSLDRGTTMALQAEKIGFGELTNDEVADLVRLILDKLDLEIWAMKWDGSPRYLEIRGKDPLQRS
jgi:hypothetical protein